ncbi:MAG: DUF3526 domain-containing protein [Gemmatimonadetes bacterium]|nr:DUF3526 domain-containing protein [Gemmatimonadota bacterium]
MMNRASRVIQVAKHEIALVRARRLPFWTAVTLGLVLGIAMVGGLTVQTAEAGIRDRYQSVVDRAWNEQPDRHPHRVAHYGFLAFRDRSPLAAFDPGVESYAGTSVFLEAHRQNLPNFGEARHATSMLRFGELSPALIFGVLVPLMILIVGHGTVSGERERGTLRLALAQGVGNGEFLAGKALGLAAVFGIVALPLLAVSLIVTAIVVDPGPFGQMWPRVLTLTGLYALYLASWVLVTVWVSNHAARSHGALGALLAYWVLTCIGLPRAVPALAGALHPSPTRAEYEAGIDGELSLMGDSHDPDDPFSGALRQEYLDRYGASSVEDLPVNWGGVVSAEGEALTTRVFVDAADRLSGVHRDQDRWATLAAFLSPYMALRGLSMRVAATDPSGMERFRADAEDFRFDMVQRLNHLHTTEILYEDDRAQRVEAEEWQRFPTFAARPPPLSQASFGEPLFGLALLFALGWPIVALRWAARGVARP